MTDRTITLPVTIAIPDEVFADLAVRSPAPDSASRDGYGSYSRIYSPRPRDISMGNASDGGGVYLSITGHFDLLAGDSRFDGGEQFGTLAEQAEAMRLIAKHATEIADELERRVQATEAPERVASPAEVEEDRARHQRAREAVPPKDVQMAEFTDVIAGGAR